jgi:hypothetical protein
MLFLSVTRAILQGGAKGTMQDCEVLSRHICMYSP